MKNLVSKLFGGLAIAALVVGSFSTSSINAQPATMNSVTVEDVKVEEMAAADWYVVCGSRWCAVVADEPADSIN